jgi:hypothetical protein
LPRHKAPRFRRSFGQKANDSGRFAERRAARFYRVRRFGAAQDSAFSGVETLRPEAGRPRKFDKRFQHDAPP